MNDVPHKPLAPGLAAAADVEVGGAPDAPSSGAPPKARRKRRRLHVQRGKTIAQKAISRTALKEFAKLYAVDLAALDGKRPKTRGECEDGPRPCPFVGCRYHLFLTVDHETGSIRFTYPNAMPWELAESCALDVADEGEHTLEQVGILDAVTRERARQIELRALHKLKAAGFDLRDLLNSGHDDAA